MRFYGKLTLLHKRTWDDGENHISPKMYMLNQVTVTCALGVVTRPTRALLERAHTCLGRRSHLPEPRRRGYV